MTALQKPSAISSIPRLLCPRCRQGRLFRDSIFRIYTLRIPRMHERCPACELKFEREPGYFLGAMYVSYGLGLATVALLAVLVWAITGWWVTKATIWALILFLPLAPAITFFARVLWMYLDWAVDPGAPVKQ